MDTIRCFACGILIGPGHEDEKPLKIGNKNLCHIHYCEVIAGSRFLKDFPSKNMQLVLSSKGEVNIVHKN